MYNVQGCLPIILKSAIVFNSTNLEDEDRNQLILIEQESLHEIWRRMRKESWFRCSPK